MYVDAQLLLSDAQALTATAVSTNIIDLGSDRDIGPGRGLSFVLTTDVAADSTTGNETYQVDIQTDDNSGFSSATTICSYVILAAALTAGSIHVLPMPNTNERYVRLNYTLGGTTPTWTVTSFVGLDAQLYQAYPNNYTIS